MKRCRSTTGLAPAFEQDGGVAAILALIGRDIAELGRDPQRGDVAGVDDADRERWRQPALEPAERRGVAYEDLETTVERNAAALFGWD